MRSDWDEDCLEYHGRILSGAGCHYCGDWDDLPIDNTCVEMRHCSCGVALTPEEKNAIPKSEDYYKFSWAD